MQPWSDTRAARWATSQARESVTVTAKVSETVEQVHFDSGDDVAAGAPLVTLTGRQQQAALAAGRSRGQRKPSSCTSARTNWPRSS